MAAAVRVTDSRTGANTSITARIDRRTAANSSNARPPPNATQRTVSSRYPVITSSAVCLRSKYRAFANPALCNSRSNSAEFRTPRNRINAWVPRSDVNSNVASRARSLSSAMSSGPTGPIRRASAIPCRNGSKNPSSNGNPVCADRTARRRASGAGKAAKRAACTCLLGRNAAAISDPAISPAARRSERNCRNGMLRCNACSTLSPETLRT